MRGCHDGPKGTDVSERLSVRVELADRSYTIEIGTESLAGAGPDIQDHCPLAHAVVVTDTNVRDQYANRVAASLAEHGADVDVLTVEAGEKSKSGETLFALWEAMMQAGADRKSAVVAVGGGVVGDLAGFVAASFARGIRFVQVPTTLLAQVDSSVGGKTGINLPNAKNMVGAFHQPHYVMIDTDVLNTLPDREYRAGMAEVVKYGFIMDEPFLDYIEGQLTEIGNRDPGTLRTIVARCCQLKAEVVRDDEREVSGRRAILNYGHTFGHALEAVLEYESLLHGEAVAIGMMCAARLAANLGRIPDQLVDRHAKLLAGIGLPTRVPVANEDALIDRMRHDKKTEYGQLRFVLPTRAGHVELVDGIDEEAVRQALR